MISEHQFSAHYASVWHSITPLADGFWSIENLTVERVVPPLEAKSPKELRAIVNETAFRAFCSLHGGPRIRDRRTIHNAIARNLADSIVYVSRFSIDSPIKGGQLDDASIEEASTLVLRLLEFFPGVEPTNLRPRFSGCGLISECEGDLIEGSCLYEVKAGDRPFRILDLRQLLTYSALAYAKGCLSFKSIGIFNPRTGVAWRKSLEEVSHSLAGTRLSDILSALVEQFSSASVSR